MDDFFNWESFDLESGCTLSIASWRPYPTTVVLPSLFLEFCHPALLIRYLVIIVQTSKAFLPAMLSSNRGHVVTVASMAGKVGVNKLIDYCSSKFAAVGFDESLRAELMVSFTTSFATVILLDYIEINWSFNNLVNLFFSVKSIFLVFICHELYNSGEQQRRRLHHAHLPVLHQHRNVWWSQIKVRKINVFCTQKSDDIFC